MSAGSAFWPLQQAVYSTLTGNVALMARINGVFDAVNEDQPFPYVTIGAVTSLPYRVMQRFGEECTITLHIWSDYNGYKEAAEILDMLNGLLADTTFPVTGWDLLSSYYDFSETMMENEDGMIIRHVPVRYRCQLLKQ